LKIDKKPLKFTLQDYKANKPHISYKNSNLNPSAVSPNCSPSENLKIDNQSKRQIKLTTAESTPSQEGDAVPPQPNTPNTSEGVHELGEDFGC